MNKFGRENYQINILSACGMKILPEDTSFGYLTNLPNYPQEVHPRSKSLGKHHFTNSEGYCFSPRKNNSFWQWDLRCYVKWCFSSLNILPSLFTSPRNTESLLHLNFNDQYLLVLGTKIPFFSHCFGSSVTYTFDLLKVITQ